MYDWITNWLIIGLALNWMGLMIQRYGPSPLAIGREIRWWYEIIAIIFWPFAFAVGIVMAEKHRRSKSK